LDEEDNNVNNIPAEEGDPVPQDPAGANDNNNNNDEVAQAAVANANGNDDGNWNPIEWDRAAEELTWERLLGFDGSLLFLEHVFWVVSLNTLFVLVFGKVICESISLFRIGMVV
jgi:hypothetical protein